MTAAAVAVLAAGLVALRDNTEGPVGNDLTAATGLSSEAIEAALAGRELPTLEVTLALVEAWGGDVPAWREYWAQIDELLTGADVPAPPPIADGASVGAQADVEPAAESDPPKTPAPTLANSDPIPPAKPSPTDPAAARRKRRRTTHRVFVAVVLLAAVASGLTAYMLTRSDDTTGSAQQSPAHPVTSAPAPGTTATSARFRPTPTPTATTPAGTPTTFQTPSDDEPTPTPSFTPTPPATTAPGTVLGLYPKIQLPSGYSVDFRNDPFHPIPGTGLGGETPGPVGAGPNTHNTQGPSDSRFPTSQNVLF